MLSLAPSLQSLLQSLPPRPVDQQALGRLVEHTLDESKTKSSPENRKSQWEYLLRNDIFSLAATEGKALKDEETAYYDNLRDKLDLILIFTEHDACEQTFPFIVLQDLLETQTIASCSHIFSWIEARSKRLTEGLVPQKGKALILLRTLNDLLRRLSKMGPTTIFCGRILTFLSGVFPLGERSGVNLRGEYGPVWEGVKLTEKSEEAIVATDAKGSGVTDKMQVDSDGGTKSSASSIKPSEQKEEFYNTFWSLQLPFSRPPLFSQTKTFSEFKDAVNKVLPVVKEATAKERAMMGSRSSGAGPAATLKRKREPEPAGERSNNEYFFAKFLTSPDLLDLEIADTHFRRQFLFQLLILLNHLLTFTKTAKSTWSSPRNRSLQMDFTLEGTDTQWVQETINKTMEELRQTTPNGRAFAETVNVILEREKNWVKWKNELCSPFDKEPWAEEVGGMKVGLEEATKKMREKMREDPKEWEWKLGSQPLTEIWEMGYRDLSDLQNPFQPGDVKDFVKKVKQEDARIEMRKKTLANAADRFSAARAKRAVPKSVATPPATDKETPLSSPLKPSPILQDSNATGETSVARPSTPGLLRSMPSSSPLHPSLPPKPGSPSKVLSSSQESTTPVPVSAPTVVPPPVVVATPALEPVQTPASISVDDQITEYEENKQRWSWLCLRTARDQYLQHFGKIGTGNLVLLAEEIEKEKREREKMQKGEDTLTTTNMVSSSMAIGDDIGGYPITTTAMSREDGHKMGGFDDTKLEGIGTSVTDGEGDIKMEEGATFP